MYMKCWKQYRQIQVSQADKNVLERADKNRTNVYIDMSRQYACQLRLECPDGTAVQTAVKKPKLLSSIGLD